MNKSFFALAVSIFLLFGCNSQTPGVKNLDANQFEKAISSAGAQLVDVRTPNEFNEKHLAGAKNIDINGPDFEESMAKLDKDKPVYIYCLSGGRSRRASDWAASNGFKDVSNLEFGINSWIDANKTVVSGNGDVLSGKSGMTFDEYLGHIKSAKKMVLVDFNAVWCGPCKILKPTVIKVVKKNSDQVELFDIDVDKNNMVASAMNVRSIPLLLLYKDGKEVWRNLGLADENLISQKIAEFSK